MITIDESQPNMVFEDGYKEEVNESRNTRLESIINECVDICLRKFLKEQTNRASLNENAQDRRVNNLIKQYYPTADFDEIRNIRANFLNLIPNARARNEKWLCKVLKWFLDGQIHPKDYKKLNNYLGWLHKNIDPEEDYNGDWEIYSYNCLMRHIDRLFPPKETLASNQITLEPKDKIQKINGFTIRRIDSQEEASKLAYSVYNGEWCILDNLFEEQVDDCTCYIISNNKTYNRCKPMPLKNIIRQLKNLGYNGIADEINGLKNASDITEYPEEYFDIAYLDNGLPPYDKYGLSAIVVLVGEDGDLYGVYSRYNLPDMRDGNILDKLGISQLIGANIDDVCPYVNR